MAVNYHNIAVESKPLDQPPLEDLAKALNAGLTTNFEQVEVAVVDCPNLTEQPFTLAKPGLGGNTKLVEVGGVPYLLPLVKKEKLYDLKHIANLVDSDPVFIIGAGAGPYNYAGVNCEGIFNLNIDNGTVSQHSRISKVDIEDESTTILDILPINETKIALLANLFFSEGKPGKVLKVHVKTRTGKNDFVTSIRTILANSFPKQNVGLGGVFLLKEGKAKQHVMPDFSKTPINNDEQLNNWLKFYDMSAPLIAVGTMINNDPGLDLRVQHFHSFSYHDEGGHYHIDTTPDTVEYLGYFNTGAQVWRVDRPVETHHFGRD